MKHLFLLITLITFSMILFSSCEEDNQLEFIAEPSEEGISFLNTFSSKYLLSVETIDNLAERFVWNKADFDAPTNVNYDLQISLSSTFDSFELIGTTTETNLTVTVGQLLDYAERLGLDDDPSTIDVNGNPNNVGIVFFRIRAYVGAGTGNNTDMLSEIMDFNIEVIEKVPTGECAGMFALGDALINVQWEWSTALVIPCESNVLQMEVALQNGTFRFFTTEFDWASGLNYPYFIDEGFTIDANFEDAMDGDNNFRFIGTPGIYDLVIDENDKRITLTERAGSALWILGDATPDGWSWETATEIAENPMNVWSTTLNFNSGTFRFFTTQDDWTSGLNFLYYVDEGYSIDPNLEDAMDGDSNFRFIGTPGIYVLVVDGNNKTITMTEDNSGSLWLIGDATPGGWSWEEATLAPKNADNVWSATLEFNAGIFRFFTVENDWASGLNYNYFLDEGYTIDANFEDAMDNDGNFKFIGTSGSYTLTVNGNDKEIVLE